MWFAKSSRDLVGFNLETFKQKGHVLIKNLVFSFPEGHVRKHFVMVNAAGLNVERVNDHDRQALRIRLFLLISQLAELLLEVDIDGEMVSPNKRVHIHLELLIQAAGLPIFIVQRLWNISVKGLPPSVDNLRFG